MDEAVITQIISGSLSVSLDEAKMFGRGLGWNLSHGLTGTTDGPRRGLAEQIE